MPDDLQIPPPPRMFRLCMCHLFCHAHLTKHCYQEHLSVLCLSKIHGLGCLGSRLIRHRSLGPDAGRHFRESMLHQPDRASLLPLRSRHRLRPRAQPQMSLFFLPSRAKVCRTALRMNLNANTRTWAALLTHWLLAQSTKRKSGQMMTTKTSSEPSRAGCFFSVRGLMMLAPLKAQGL